MDTKFRSETLKKLAPLTLNELQSTVGELLAIKYKVAYATIQRYATWRFGIPRKRTPTKLPGRYGHLNWQLNDTELANQICKERGKSPKDLKALRSARERIRQVRILLGKGKATNYRKRLPKA